MPPRGSNGRDNVHIIFSSSRGLSFIFWYFWSSEVTITSMLSLAYPFQSGCIHASYRYSFRHKPNRHSFLEVKAIHWNISLQLQKLCPFATVCHRLSIEQMMWTGKQACWSIKWGNQTATKNKSLYFRRTRRLNQRNAQPDWDLTQQAARTNGRSWQTDGRGSTT